MYTERFSELSASLNLFEMKLLKNNEEIDPLKAWEFQGFMLQAAQRIAAVQGDESFKMLELTTQNFFTSGKVFLLLCCTKHYIRFCTFLKKKNNLDPKCLIKPISG